MTLFRDCNNDPSGAIPDHICGACYHPFDACRHCDREAAAARDDVATLLADHGEALKFVREMAVQPCPHWCADDCLACRSKAWLHEAKPKAMKPPFERSL